MKLTSSILLLAAMLLSNPPYADEGKSIYDHSCKMCHDSGMGGTPKISDKNAWEDRLAGGLDYLVKSAIEGKQGYSGMMPPRGGNPKLSDQQVREAVSYMITQVK